jgi:predicted ATPase
MFWKWQKLKDPLINEYGSLNELRNKNADSNDEIKIGVALENAANSFFLVFKQENIISPIDEGTNSLLPMLCYLCAERWGPRPLLPTFTSIDKLMHVGEHGEYVIDFLSQHERDIVPEIMWHPKSEGQTLEYNVRAWLSEISPNIKLIQHVDHSSDLSYFKVNSFRPNNVGFGISYSLPILVLLLGMASEWSDHSSFKDNGVIVLIENPEAHIHPKGQTLIGQFISKAVAAGLQVIIETHSDHVLDGIRLSVQDKTLKPSQIAFHYFSLEDNHSVIQSPEIYDTGKLSFWPEGFFDQTLKDRSRLAK